MTSARAVQTKMIEEERAARAVRLQARLDRLKVPMSRSDTCACVCAASKYALSRVVNKRYAYRRWRLQRTTKSDSTREQRSRPVPVLDQRINPHSPAAIC